jgi:hypothetical protein
LDGGADVDSGADVDDGADEDDGAALLDPELHATPITATSSRGTARIRITGDLREGEFN